MDPARLTELFRRDLASLNASRRRLTLQLHPTELLALYTLLRMAEEHPWCTGSLAEFAGDLARRCQPACMPTLALQAGMDLALPRRDADWPASEPRRWPADPGARAIYRERWRPVKARSDGWVSPEDRRRLARRRRAWDRCTHQAREAGSTAGAIGWPADGNPFDAEMERSIWFAWLSGWKEGNAFYLRGLEKEPLWP